MTARSIRLLSWHSYDLDDPIIGNSTPERLSYLPYSGRDRWFTRPETLTWPIQVNAAAMSGGSNLDQNLEQTRGIDSYMSSAMVPATTVLARWSADDSLPLQPVIRQ